MSEPGGVTAETARQLFLVGQLFGSVHGGEDPKEVIPLVEKIDPDLLQSYLDTHPEVKGFKYRAEVETAIRVVRTLKSFLG